VEIPFGFTVPLRVAEVVVMDVADPVVAEGPQTTAMSKLSDADNDRLSVTVNWNRKTAPAGATIGAVKVGLTAVVLESVTAVPATCCHR
jgi:hypothetical protein